MKLGERQTSTKMENIAPNHRARYIFASKYIRPGDMVLDAICGIGYGSKLMAMLSASKVMAFDRDEEAIVSAKRFYSSPNIDFIQSDFCDIKLPSNTFDLITCFEAVEHVNDDRALIEKLVYLLKDNGTLILSTPNEKNLHWSADKFPEHVKHYTQSELDALIESCGLKVDSWQNQKGKWSFDIGDGGDGDFMIAVCNKQ